MMINSDNYFDFWDIFRNELIGSTELFITIGAVIIILGMLKYKAPLEAQIITIILWFSIIFAKTYNILIWSTVLLTVGFIFYYSLRKLFR